MIRSGLVSITFRQRAAREVVDLVARASLAGIEWGGDVHVPHGDVACAKEVARMTADAGLVTAAYGSYYRAGDGRTRSKHGDEKPVDFEAVLETAVALGAPLIRVWPGSLGSVEAPDAYRGAVTDDLRRIADLSQQAGVGIVCESHGGTLTDAPKSARALLEQTAHPNVRCYWQRQRGLDEAAALASLDSVWPWLGGLHVFHWHVETGERLPISDDADFWPKVLACAGASGHDLFALMEFVRDDAPEAFATDAAALKAWLGPRK